VKGSVSTSFKGGIFITALAGMGYQPKGGGNQAGIMLQPQMTPFVVTKT
jgi:hypothetical protein